jgi:predicted GTPase
MNRLRMLIMGAAGRDFHNFNVVYRGDQRYEVVGFMAALAIADGDPEW